MKGLKFASRMRTFFIMQSVNRDGEHMHVLTNILLAETSASIHDLILVEEIVHSVCSQKTPQRLGS